MIKLLAVDDEPSFLEMIQLYFEPRGYKVLLALEGDTALKIAQDEQPDIALIDLKMPGKYGDEVMLAMKKISPHTKSIMITALEGVEENREKFMKMGAADCFDKPVVSLKDLESKVKEVLSLP